MATRPSEIRKAPGRGVAREKKHVHACPRGKKVARRAAQRDKDQGALLQSHVQSRPQKDKRLFVFVFFCSRNTKERVYFDTKTPMQIAHAPCMCRDVWSLESVVVRGLSCAFLWLSAGLLNRHAQPESRNGATPLSERQKAVAAAAYLHELRWGKLV